MKTAIVSKGQDLKSLRHTWTCKLEMKTWSSRGYLWLPPLGLGARSTSLLPGDSLLLSWSRAFLSALLMAAAGGNCCMSCSLSHCGFNLAGFWPHSAQVWVREGIGEQSTLCREQMWTSQHTELVGKEVRRRDWFSPSTPWLAPWISLCGTSHTTVGQPSPPHHIFSPHYSSIQP